MEGFSKDFGTGYGFSDGSQFSSNPTFSHEIDKILRQVQELHDLDENEWSMRTYKKQYNVPAWKGSYNKERNVMRIKGGVKAPLEKVLTYILEPPYGVRNQGKVEASNRIIEKIGSGAVLFYHEGQGKVLCCCRIAPRDGVFIAGLKLLTTDTAIFAMKTVDHPSYPPKEDGYRVNAPLIGLFVQQEGDVTNVESFLAEMDLGGKFGKVGPGKALGQAVQQMVYLARDIPRQQDVAPPYRQLL